MPKIILSISSKFKYNLIDMKELENFPWSSDDIYLKDGTNQIRAVCSNADIADTLADVINNNLVIQHGDPKVRDFIQSAYVLKIMIGKAKIEVKDINTMFLEKAYHDFSDKLDTILKSFNLKIKDQIEEVQKQEDTICSVDVSSDVKVDQRDDINETLQKCTDKLKQLFHLI